mgnify:CR=1 FL=1
MNILMNKMLAVGKLTYYGIVYYLCSRQGAEDPQGFQVEAHGVYLIKVDNWPMSGPEIKPGTY